MYASRYLMMCTDRFLIDLILQVKTHEARTIMCGIAGIATCDDIDLERALSNMVGSLAHRGPDAQGTLIRPSGRWRVALGHTRLSILDLSDAGRQPMAGSSEGPWITYNGEVYNFQELRRDLPADSMDFSSATDTEVIVRAYRHWGLRVLPRLRGMFALGIWDERAQQLILARDPFGIKPLYFFRRGRTLVFASEIRALLNSGIVPRRLSPDGVASFLRTGAVESPLTIIDGVRSLDPGHYAVVRFNDSEVWVDQAHYAAGLFRPHRNWPSNGRRTAVAHLYDILKESVRLHLVSDVPLGVFLSGGIDSSVLVALVRQTIRDTPKTFSVVFSDKKFSEHESAEVIAKRYETDHHQVLLSEDDLLKLLPDSLRAMDQPTIDGVNTYVISKAVKEAGVTVALSGLGGDELFAGYSSFKRAKKIAALRKVPRSVRKAGAAVGKMVYNGSVGRTKFWDLLASDASPNAAYSVSRRLFSPAEISHLTGSSCAALDGSWRPTHPDAINAVSRLEMQGYMANMLLRDSDVMSMAHALEIRVPFVDVEVVRYVMSLPGAWKVSEAKPKAMLVDALQGFLPEQIWRRPKMGFTLPFERWIGSSLKPRLDEVFQSPGGFRATGLNAIVAQQIWNRLQQKPHCEKWSRSWALFVLENWCVHNAVQA
jgi:asparagine synthase (glutamine-hydrolysing)